MDVLYREVCIYRVGYENIENCRSVGGKWKTRYLIVNRDKYRKVSCYVGLIQFILFLLLAAAYI